MVCFEWIFASKSFEKLGRYYVQANKITHNSLNDIQGCFADNYGILKKGPHCDFYTVFNFAEGEILTNERFQLGKVKTDSPSLNHFKCYSAFNFMAYSV